MEYLILVTILAVILALVRIQSKAPKSGVIKNVRKKAAEKVIMKQARQGEAGAYM